MEDTIAEQFEIFAQYVRDQGLRMTRQRELVVDTFLRTEGHISTDELFNLVRKVDGKVGYATVFRTLKALTDCGLARETDLNDGRARFEHLYKHPHHHHIICVECGRTIEFFSPELEHLQAEIVAEYGFTPLHSKLQISGVCRECQAEEESLPDIPDVEQVFARDALRIAMETERRGVRFYKTATEIVSRPVTKETFKRMLADEKKHFRDLSREWDRLVKKNRRILDAPVFLHFDFEALAQIFPSREEINRRLSPGMSEREALELAMAMEKDAYDYFSKYAEKFSDSMGRDIFEKFAEEEQEHYDTIKAALESLGD